MKFSEFYQSVIGARPEAKVPGLMLNKYGKWEHKELCRIGTAMYGSDDYFAFGDDIARAMSLRHWLTLLPEMCSPVQVFGGGYVVVQFGNGYGMKEIHSTPMWMWARKDNPPDILEAVGEYLKARKG